MNSPKYVFDTNIFIKMSQQYKADIFVSLWQNIEGLIDDGTIISSDQVFTELEKIDDALLAWAKECPSLFWNSDIPVQKVVRGILAQFSRLVTRAKTPNSADPFVISLAKLNDCTLVTEERQGSFEAPKIPFICNAFEVKCIKFFDFLRETNMKF